jgi:hypothetical protein|tara:strand:- start:3955 stop:4236 length:282 start_codon:yes stop_codon:yes gene_type:complete
MKKLNPNQKKIQEVSKRVCDMLIEKNQAYGNSALTPVNIFSKANAIDGLSARIDDKLSRIKNRGISDRTEDTLFDLCGYFILLIIAQENLHKK